MKVLWVEDSERVCELLTIAATKAVRARLQIDMVLAMSLMEAERRLRLEPFDLVILDLGLPDSFDEDMAISRIANMGTHRLAVVSASDDRQRAVDNALRYGCDMSPLAIAKDTLPFNRFIQRPDTFGAFLDDLMDREDEVQAA
jgi:DNA-binding response OmpR family regulator